MMTLNGHHEGLSFFVNRVCNDAAFCVFYFNCQEIRTNLVWKLG